MLFQDILILLAFGIGVFFIGIPLYKIVKITLPQKRDPVKEAQIRLEMARKENEAAHLNKEAEKLYETMYEEALDDQEASDFDKKINRK